MSVQGMEKLYEVVTRGFCDVEPQSSPPHNQMYYFFHGRQMSSLTTIRQRQFPTPLMRTTYISSYIV